MSGDCEEQLKFLKIVSEEDAEKQVTDLEILLRGSFRMLINDRIPSTGMTPLEIYIQQFGDDRMEFFELLLASSDISEARSDGSSVFNYLVPMRVEKISIMYRLLEQISDTGRKACILHSLLTSADYQTQREIEFRLRTMFPDEWEQVGGRWQRSPSRYSNTA